MNKKQLQGYLKLLKHWEREGKKGLGSKIKETVESLRALKKKDKPKAKMVEIEIEAVAAFPNPLSITDSIARYYGYPQPLIILPESYDNE